MLDDAMSEDGYVAPMTAAADREVIDGSARLERAYDKFNDEAIIVEHDGTKPIIAVRTDIPNAQTPEAQRIAVRANRIAQVDLSWNPEILSELAPEALEGMFSDKELAEILAETGAGSQPLEAKELPEGKYSVIYADPPWEYSNSGFGQSAASHYMTMGLDDICAMPVSDLAADDCALLMWATSPLLEDAFRVVTAWGFEYKSSFVWVKDRAPGLGWYVNTKHEHLLIGVKGQAIPAEKIDSIISGSVTKHSKKPDSVYEIIHRMYPQGKRIELFARQRHEGWAVFGNQVAGEKVSQAEAVA